MDVKRSGDRWPWGLSLGALPHSIAGGSVASTKVARVPVPMCKTSPQQLAVQHLSQCRGCRPSRGSRSLLHSVCLWNTSITKPALGSRRWWQLCNRQTLAEAHMQPLDAPELPYDTQDSAPMKKAETQEH